MSKTGIEPNDIHALLSEHFQFSLGSNYTGFQVRQTDPVVVTYNIAHSAFLAMSEEEVRMTTLREISRMLFDLGYLTTLGSNTSNNEPVLIITGRTR